MNSINEKILSNNTLTYYFSWGVIPFIFSIGLLIFELLQIPIVPLDVVFFGTTALISLGVLAYILIRENYEITNDNIIVQNVLGKEKYRISFSKINSYCMDKGNIIVFSHHQKIKLPSDRFSETVQ